MQPEAARSLRWKSRIWLWIKSAESSTLPVRSGIFPAMSVNKGHHRHQHCCHQQRGAGEPAGAQEGQNACPLLPSSCSHSLGWAPRKLRSQKHRRLALDSWGTYQRDNFSEPRRLNLPINRRVLNSLTWAVWLFSNNSLLMFWLPALCCQAAIEAGSSPHLPRAALSQLLVMLF